MTNTPTQFSTCPHCSANTPIPEGLWVFWAAQPCAGCNTPHVAPRTFTRDEVQSIILRHSAWLTGEHSNQPGKNTIQQSENLD